MDCGAIGHEACSAEVAKAGAAKVRLSDTLGIGLNSIGWHYDRLLR